MNTTAIHPDDIPPRWHAARVAFAAVAVVILIAVSFVVGRVTAASGTAAKPGTPTASTLASPATTATPAPPVSTGRITWEMCPPHHAC
jgi:hypothetical protein